MSWHLTIGSTRNQWKKLTGSLTSDEEEGAGVGIVMCSCDVLNMPVLPSTPSKCDSVPSAKPSFSVSDDFGCVWIPRFRIPLQLLSLSGFPPYVSPKTSSKSSCSEPHRRALFRVLFLSGSTANGQRGSMALHSCQAQILGRTIPWPRPSQARVTWRSTPSQKTHPKTHLLGGSSQFQYTP